MHIIFCSDPLAPRAVDDAYADEAQAAMASGLEYHLISYEQLVHQHDAAAVRRVPRAEAPELAIYRGWMLRPSEYQALYDALRARGIELINSPAAYRTCHYLPESYPLIREETAATVWLPLDACGDLDTFMALLAPFGDQPVIIKDFVKSRKHEWFAACYIPSAADRQAVDRVVTRFLELQGDDISAGLVFRAYVALQPIGAHPQSGMPLTREHRLVFLDGMLLADAPYWDAPIDETAELPIDHFRVAQRVGGSWMIVEPGDAQVAGLLERMDVTASYTALSRCAQRDTGAAP